MPILLVENLPIVASRKEFLSMRETIIDKKLEYSQKELDDYFTITMIKIAENREMSKDYNAEAKFSFAYYGEEVQEVVLEILLFHSHFYGGFEVIGLNDDDTETILSITHIIRSSPNRNLYSFRTVKINYKNLIIQIHPSLIKGIRGLVNNFVIETDNVLIFFSSTPSIKERILVKENLYKDRLFDSNRSINCRDYILTRNLPSKRELGKYRQSGRLCIMA